MAIHEPVIRKFEPAKGNAATYTAGFILSLILTAAAYLLVTRHSASGNALIAVLFTLAIAQLSVQLLFFLHLGQETKPRLNLMAFLFMAMVVLIIGIGSLWIMKNLSYHAMPESELRIHMHTEEGL